MKVKDFFNKTILTIACLVTLSYGQYGYATYDTKWAGQGFVNFIFSDNINDEDIACLEKLLRLRQEILSLIIRLDNKTTIEGKIRKKLATIIKREFKGTIYIDLHGGNLDFDTFDMFMYFFEYMYKKHGITIYLTGAIIPSLDQTTIVKWFKRNGLRIGKVVTFDDVFLNEVLSSYIELVLACPDSKSRLSFVNQYVECSLFLTGLQARCGGCPSLQTHDLPPDLAKKILEKYIKPTYLDYRGNTAGLLHRALAQLVTVFEPMTDTDAATDGAAAPSATPYQGTQEQQPTEEERTDIAWLSSFISSCTIL